MIPQNRSNQPFAFAAAHLTAAPQLGVNPPGCPHGFQLVNAPLRTASVGAAPPLQIQYRWLPWIAGQVSMVPAAGPPVISGEFTGCWLVEFNLGATRYIGHIGTDTSPNHPNSLDVKNAWKVAINSNAITPLKAFKPTDATNAQLQGAVAGKLAPRFYSMSSVAQGHYHLVLGLTHGAALQFSSARAAATVPRPNL